MIDSGAVEFNRLFNFAKEFTMTNQTNSGIFIPQKQVILLLASIMITISAAIIFSAMFVTNFVQGKVASAQSPSPTQAVTSPTTPPAAAYANWSYGTESPYTTACTVSANNLPSASNAPVATSNSSRNSSPTSTSRGGSSYVNSSNHHASKSHMPRAPKHNTPRTYTSTSTNTNNSYNTYNKNTSIDNTDNSAYYSHSFNQGSYNNVKGDLTQTNNSNSDVDTTTTTINQTNNNNSHKHRGSYDNRNDRDDRSDRDDRNNGPRNNSRDRDNRDNRNDNRRDNDNRNDRSPRQHQATSSVAAIVEE